MSAEARSVLSMNFSLPPVLRMVRRTPSSSQRVIVSGFESWGTSGYALSVLR